MKKHIIGIMLMAAAGFATTSCGDDFLEETNTTSYDTSYLETAEGVKAQATALYGNIRWHFGYEWAYGITLYGTDEFTSANDLTSEPWNKYDSRLGAADITTSLGAANGNCPSVSFLWDQMYYGIAAANNVIKNGEALGDLDLYVGEGYFLRGYNYYRLFAQYGGVVLVTEPTEGVVRNFTRSSEEETLNLIISDFEKAYSLLSTSKWRGYGTWTKYTAAHFLAKALLYRQSERSESWNSSYDKSTDLNRCISLCNEVIAACPLESDYNNLYSNWTGIDCAIEGSDEILMSAQHNADSSTVGRYGNRTYNYFNCQFATASAGWVARGVWLGGMDFQRCRPTEYNYKCFDHVNDSRMWKEFRTIFGINTIVDAEKCKVGNFPGQTSDTELGDEGIVFIINTKDDHRFDDVVWGAAGSSEWVNPETGKWVPNAMALYQNGAYIGENFGTATGDYSNFWPGINKTDDGTRQAEKGDSFRDVTMARTGETVLIKAEAQVRLGNYQDAITTVNALRERAQWRADEDRGSYVDGTKAFELSNALYSTYKDNYENSNPWINSYWLSTGLDKETDNYQASDLLITSYTQLPAEDEEILSELGCSGDYDRMLNFIFNERTREMDGEWNRWEELARCKLLHRRTIPYNSIASANLTTDQNSNGSHFLYRAIPQTFIDGLLNEDGSNLTSEQQAALQNPGY